MKCYRLMMFILITPGLVIAQTSEEPSARQQENTDPDQEVQLEDESAISLPRLTDIRSYDHLTGDWSGARTAMENKGIELFFSMTNVYQHNTHGGLQTHRGHRFTGSVDYEVTLDSETLQLWEDGIFYILAESDWNDGIGEDRVGNLFGVNGDAGGDVTIVVDEAWYEHTLWEGNARLRVGKMDVGVDFDTNAYANDETAQFLNPALVGTGNIPMPDFGLGAQIMIEPSDWFYMGIVAADAQADGRETGFRTALHGEDYFYAGLELGLMPEWDTQMGKLPGTYRFGVWYDSRHKEMYFNDFGGRLTSVPTKRDDLGFYLNMDQVLYRENRNDEFDEQGLGMFFRYGFAHAESNEIEHFWSLGAQYLGLIPARDNDVLGLGFAQGILSKKLRKITDGNRESVFEIYYSAQITPWFFITPDLQYVVNPGADNRGRDSFVASVRLQMSF